MRLNINKSYKYKRHRFLAVSGFRLKTATEGNFNRFFSLDVGLPFVTFMKEIKLVVTEKLHFDNQDESFSSQLSGNFGLT